MTSPVSRPAEFGSIRAQAPTGRLTIRISVPPTYLALVSAFTAFFAMTVILGILVAARSVVGAGSDGTDSLISPDPLVAQSGDDVGAAFSRRTEATEVWEGDRTGTRAGDEGVPSRPRLIRTVWGWSTRELTRGG